MHDEKKKLFTNLKIGQWLKEKAPEVLDVVDDYLPPVKVLTALVSKNGSMSPEDNLEFGKLLREYELEVYRIEVSDRQGARNREIEKTKAGKNDFMFLLTGIVGLSAFIAVVLAIIFSEIPESNKELFIHLVGIVEGVALTMFAYYFGTSKSSNDKTKMLAKNE